ncbi:MAG: GNAT family N-acetyltransferase [Thiofilum sp.]|uniref:GNAT family N-acetyltransferase n=1 Tax=Thiofilum sp. TaxID=2212733 RepID=UPI0025DF0EB0|nr:GNAT family N-acetyltransferase [Thiofilum sp.]MBK8453855.1 GNAT family N-acetyltransferase [Thiofilum sp.]
MKYLVEPITKDQISEVAKTHRESYPKDHLSGSLSQKLLEKYYSLFLSNDVVSIACLNQQKNNLLGFLFFGKDLPSKISQFKQKERVELFFYFIFKPKLLLKILLKKLKHSFQHSESFVEASDIILSIAARPDTKGVGTCLMEWAFEYCRHNQIKRLGLYVTCSNLVAINFYIKSGFIITGYIKGQYYMEKQLENKT